VSENNIGDILAEYGLYNMNDISGMTSSEIDKENFKNLGLSSNALRTLSSKFNLELEVLETKEMLAISVENIDYAITRIIKKHCL